MARLAVIAAVLFFLFAVTVSRSPVDLPEKEAADAKRTILLPRENPRDIENLPAASIARSKPASFVVFKPINRRFPVAHSSLRLPIRRPCRHHFNQMQRFRGPHQVSYGNDMIPSGENSDFEFPTTAISGGVRQIPARWIWVDHRDRLRHHGGDRVPEFPFNRHEKFGVKDEFRKHFHHEEEKKKPKHEEREEGGFDFVKRIRKFLTHF